MRNARVIFGGRGESPFFSGKIWQQKTRPKYQNKITRRNSRKKISTKKWLRDVAHLMLMKASSPPVRSSNSSVSWVSTSNVTYWNISNRQNEWTGFFSVATGQCQRELIYKTPESSSASSCSPYFSLVIMPLAYKRLRKWWNETIFAQIFPRLSSSVFSCLQVSFDLDEDESSTIYLYFSLRRFQEFHLVYIYRRLYNICTIYSTNLTWSERMALNQLLDWPFLKGNNKDSDIHPASKKKNSPLNPKKKWWVPTQ